MLNNDHIIAHKMLSISATGILSQSLGHASSKQSLGVMPGKIIICHFGILEGHDNHCRNNYCDNHCQNNYCEDNNIISMLSLVLLLLVFNLNTLTSNIKCSIHNIAIS